MIYLDNAATTYPKPEEVYKALDEANRNSFNAGRGEYEVSKKAFKLIYDTRSRLGKLINVQAERVIFTSSATESLNLIINGMNFSRGDYVYISPFEHNAVVRPLNTLKKKFGLNIKTLPFNQKTWLPDLDRIKNEFVINKPKAVFISHVSNVTGYMVPYKDIFELSKTYNSINVLDCAQSLGIINPETDNVDYVIFAGHKSLYASFGVAGFVKLGEDNLEIFKSGGTGSDSLNPEMPDTLPYKYEAGSPNYVAIAGLNESLRWLENHDVYSHELKIYSMLVKELSKFENVEIYNPGYDTFGVISFNVKGYDSSDVATILDEDFEICVRAGYHCAPLIHDFLDTKKYNGTVRVSLSYFNTKEEIDILINALNKL